MVLCGETCPVTVKVLPRTGPVGTSWFFTSSGSTALTREGLPLVCLGVKDFWFLRTRREQQQPMVSDKGGLCHSGVLAGLL